MKLHIGGLMLVLFSLVLPLVAQDSGNTIDPTHKKIVWNNTTVTLTGPNAAGDAGSAPTVLQVTGGNGAGSNIPDRGGSGGGMQLVAGTGGGGFCSGGRCGNGGNGGSIQVTGGNGGNAVGFMRVGGDGSSITLQPGARGTGNGGNGKPGNVLIALPPEGTLEVATGGLTLADAWTTRSSRRFKTNIQPLQGALEKVEQLQGVSYERKADGKHEIGVVAEDVDEIVPEVVSHDPKTNEVQGVDYSRLAALLIEAVKTQQAEIQQMVLAFVLCSLVAWMLLRRFPAKASERGEKLLDCAA
jgi:hypothetical protein